MRNFCLLTFLPLFIGFLTSCGSKPGSVTQPLSADQKAEFDQTVKAIGSAERASELANQARQRPASKAGKAVATFPQEMIDRLKQCEFEVKNPKSMNLSPGEEVKSEIDIGLKLKGDKCPVSFDLSLNGEFEISPTLTKADMKFSYDYSVIDSQFESYVDVTEMSASGSGKFSKTESEVSGDFDIRGSAKSKKQGALKFYVVSKISGPNQSASGESVFGVEYSDHTAELKDVLTTTNGVGSRAYTLNGEKITEDQFRNYIRDLGSLGQSTDQSLSGESKGPTPISESEPSPKP